MKTFFLGITLTCLLVSGGLRAQGFDEKIQDIFQAALDTRLLGLGQSGRNFSLSNNQLSRATLDGFVDILQTGVTHFPAGATATGLSFDFSNGVPVTETQSLGPIFAERAATLGKGRFNVGFLSNYLNYQTLRGQKLSDLTFVFTHNDIGLSGLGDMPAEWDRVELAMNLGIRATIFSFVGTVGISDRIDLGVALPFLSVKVQSDPVATLVSQTYLQSGVANFYYGGSETAPELSTVLPGINEEASGLGDLVLRGKYHFVKDNRLDLAAMAQLSLATGDAANFLGSGEGYLKLGVIGSTHYGNMTPHVNLFYQRASGGSRGDELALYLGYDHQVNPAFTLAVDVLSEFQIHPIEEGYRLPGSVEYRQEVSNNVTYRRRVPLSNIPFWERDHYVNAAFGIKYSPREDMIILSNLLLPLNSGGLRTALTPSLGFDFSF
ncbi:MAG TPA: hypothetical protein PKV71_01130 [Calditrichia bacterium]|nr:hypothetical protein [Calditrichota bacterium]HQV30442.1 hypothetical protein [Calditrichia bacterium]